jgi:CRISPR/Cas system Type II protein with McrA/HNH and RuvC-like nuclease domain
METVKKYSDSKSYRESQKALHHQGIEDAAQDSIKAIGLLLDFDEDLSPATEQRLREILKALVVIRHKNRVIKEHNP